MAKDFSRIFTKEDIWAQLEALNIPRDRVVLMHSSLRLIGNVEGGAEALLDVLIEYFTEKGGLFCVPTHTWRNLAKDIVLDMNDPTTSLGVFSNIAAADKRAVRTENPTHSMAVFGNRERALSFAAGELDVCSGTSPESCYGKIYREGGFVLLVGVAQNRNTYLHSVEEMINAPDRLSEEKREVVIKRADGELVKRMIHTHRTSYTKDVSQLFLRYETAFRYHGAITDGFMGNAPVQACDAVIMKETVETIWERAEGADPLAGSLALPPKWYAVR